LVKVPSIGDLGADRIKLESLTEQHCNPTYMIGANPKWNEEREG